MSTTMKARRRLCAAAGALVVTAGLTAFTHSPRASLGASVGAVSPCATDSTYHRLDFWVGEWDVYDTTGHKYATQVVRPVLDGCAYTADWTGPDGDRGLSVIAYDPTAKVWRQLYAFNQVPYTGAVALRVSDDSYHGAGLRLTSLATGASTGPARSRVTLSPLPGGRARQVLEATDDNGRSWKTIFNAEHRRRR